MKRQQPDYFHLILISGYILLGFGLLLMLWAFWPVAQTTSPVTITEYNRALPGDSSLRIWQPVTVTWRTPEAMHSGQTGPVFLDVSIPMEAAPANATDVFQTYHVYVVSRIDSESLVLHPRGDLIAEMIPGKVIHQVWSISPSDGGLIDCTAWVYFRFVQKNGGDTLERPIISRPFKVEVSTLAGINPDVIRWSGIGLAVLSIGIILVCWKLRKRMKKDKDLKK